MMAVLKSRTGAFIRVLFVAAFLFATAGYTFAQFGRGGFLSHGSEESGQPPSLRVGCLRQPDLLEDRCCDDARLDQSNVVDSAEPRPLAGHRPAFADAYRGNELEYLHLGRIERARDEVNDERAAKRHWTSVRFILREPVAVSRRLAEHQVLRLFRRRQTTIRREESA